jgi:hypothetical protein
LKNHSSNCKQQMLNWVLTGDTYTTSDDWAHETEYIEEEEEEEVPQPQHDETGYRGSSDIDPDELQEEEEDDQFELPELPNPDSIEVPDESQYETPDNSFGQPGHHSTPTNTGARPKEPANQEPLPLYRAFGPEDLYQARLQQIHSEYNSAFQQVKDSKTAKKLRHQLLQQLQDAETSFKLVKKRPDILQLSPEQLKDALKTSKDLLLPQPEPKKGFFKRKTQPIATTSSTTSDNTATPKYMTRTQTGTLPAPRTPATAKKK